MPTPAEPLSTSNPSRGEWTFIVCLTLAAFALRGGGLSRVSIEHFDEAIYASNLLFGEAEGYSYPNREFFAPPLFPFLVEWMMIFTGVSGQTAMYVNVLFGSLTIPLLWFVGRTWFGPVCGSVAAFIACGYDFHIFYSRTALTDVSLCFWWLLAVWAYERSFTLRSWKYAIAAGLFSGLAWATKYNGWITWLIAVTGGLGYVLFSLKSEPLAKQLKLWSMVCGVSAVTMLVCWYPVWSDLQEVGGYSAVAANHRGYFVGVGGWLRSFGNQMDHQHVFQGFQTIFCLTFPYISMVFSVFHYRRRIGIDHSRPDPKSTDIHLSGFMFFTTLLSLFLMGIIAGIELLVVIGSVIYIGDLLLTASGYGQRRLKFFSALPARFSIAGLWLLGSWVLGLLLATPLYQPYPRLILPLLIATWLAYGMLMAALLDEVQLRLATRHASPPPFEPSRRVMYWSIGVTVLVAVSMSLRNDFPTRLFPAGQPRLGLDLVSNQIAEAILNDTVSRKTVPAKDRAIVYVWGEPAVVFHLRAAGWPLVAPVASSSFMEPVPGAPDLPTYLVVGPHYKCDVSNGVYDLTGRFELVGKFSFTPSDLVAFDEQPPQAFAQAVSHEDELVSLFRIK